VEGLTADLGGNSWLFFLKALILTDIKGHPASTSVAGSAGVAFSYHGGVRQVALAKQHHVLAVAIVLDAPASVCAERNAGRPERDLPDIDDHRRPRRRHQRGVGLGLKRSLALREFVLGIEALERFVAGEPLYRVHECVFGVLALESEPVDPRL
jgi:hypothetical protein